MRNNDISMRKELKEHFLVEQFNDMQKSAIKSISEHKHDVVILSPTGTGKTLAYLIPLIESIDTTSTKVQAIVVLPSRELARQSLDVINRLEKSVKAYACYGGRAAMDEHRELRDIKPQVLFVTPGRLNDHIDKGNVNTDNVKWLVIDEFDKCLEFGFHDEMLKALSQMPSNALHVLLSATELDEIPRFVNMKNVEKLNFLSSQDPLDGRIEVYVVNSPDKDKLNTLSQLLRSFGAERTIVYLNYRDSVLRVVEYLRSLGFVCSSLHGGLEQLERNEAVYLFMNKSSNILISTNLSARGLDIPDVDNIVNYHLPETETDYTHRIGRTARWNSSGKCFFILSPEEKLPNYVKDIKEDNIPATIPNNFLPIMTTLYIGKGKKDKVSKADVLGLLCKKGGLLSSDVGRIDVYDRYARVAIVRSKASRVLEQLRVEKIKGVKTIVEELNPTHFK